MAAIDDLTAKVTELQTALDDEQAQVNAKLDELAAQIAALQAALGDVVTSEQVAGVIASIDATIADLRETVS